MAFSEKIRKDMDSKVQSLGSVLAWTRPRQGWVRTIRGALGMSSRQLAERIKAKPPRVFEIEKDELRGALTLETMRKTAEAMGCDFVYAFIPKKGMTLEGIMRQQAESKVVKNMSSVSHTMALEDQEVFRASTDEQKETLIQEMLRKPPRWFWDLP